MKWVREWSQFDMIFPYYNISIQSISRKYLHVHLWLNVIKQNLQKIARVAQIESCLGNKNVVTVLNIYNILLKSDICVYEEAESWQPNNL